ncbi:MAG: hypothetical protein Q8R98_28950 [Rubrivivax sp.]|nr:hypothetical protein [Rubrivivax sp.]MDZ4054371.1 hypothetical protein [Phenylobacterium sp.]
MFQIIEVEHVVDPPLTPKVIKINSAREALQVARTALAIGRRSGARRPVVPPTVHMIYAAAINLSASKRCLTALRLAFPSEPAATFDNLAAFVPAAAKTSGAVFAVPPSPRQSRMVAGQLVALAQSDIFCGGLITRLGCGEVVIVAAFDSRRGAGDHIRRLQRANRDPHVLYGPSAETWALSAIPALILLSGYCRSSAAAYAGPWEAWALDHPILATDYALIEHRWDQLILASVPTSRHHIRPSDVVPLHLGAADQASIVAFLERHSLSLVHRRKDGPAAAVEALMGRSTHPHLLFHNDGFLTVRAAARVARRSKTQPLKDYLPADPEPPKPLRRAARSRPGVQRPQPKRLRPPPPAQHFRHVPQYTGPEWIG